MKVNRLKKLKRNLYEVEFNNGIKLKIYDDLIVKYNLLTKKDLDNELYLNVIKENDNMEAYYHALAFIKRKLRSEVETRKFLFQKKYDPLIIEEVISKLKQENYLNVEAYLRAFIYDRVNLSNDGYFKIMAELKKHSFDEETIINYLDEIEKDVWVQKLIRLVEKKIKANTKYSGNKLKQKIVYELVNLGYEKEMIEIVLGNYSLKDNSILLKEYNKIKQRLLKKYSGKELDYQIRNKLYQKGFNSEDISKLININEEIN